MEELWREMWEANHPQRVSITPYVYLLMHACSHRSRAPCYDCCKLDLTTAAAAAAAALHRYLDDRITPFTDVNKRRK